eukprot:scaffold8630_cov112-Ochromonas_danica.AAC.1
MIWRVGEYGGGDVVLGRGDGRGSLVMEEEKLSEVVNPMSTASKVGSCDVKGDGNSSRAVVGGSLDVSSNSTTTGVHCASAAVSPAASLSSPRSSSLCFSSGDYVIRVTMMVGCLLTFGAVGEGKEVDNRVLEEKKEGEESVVEEASVSVRGERQEGKMKVDGDGEEEKA